MQKIKVIERCAPDGMASSASGNPVEFLSNSQTSGNTKRKPSGIVLYDKRYTFDEFLSDHSRLLTIELTRKCNLRCEYCGFGKHYTRYRSHSAESVPREIAEKAIADHLNKKKSGRTVAFYGGEPLLEFALLEYLVLFAKKFSKDAAMPMPSFSITTNGTLLTEDIIHFLVEHDFSVLLSIDGDRETHNRFRLFQCDGRGSFDVVEENLWRFVELYPDYLKRGLSVTTTACTNFRKTNEFLKDVTLFYPSIIINGTNPFLGVNYPIDAVACERAGCARLESASRNAVPDFLDWTNERIEKMQECLNDFKATLLRSWQQACDEWPFFYPNHLQRMLRIHERKVTRSSYGKLACACLPGAVRLFCDIDGNYYPCERVETSNTNLCIGNVWTGIDAGKVRSMIDYMIDVTNCEDCTGKHLCSICPSSMTNNHLEELCDAEILRHCYDHPRAVMTNLIDYTTIMEVYPSKLDAILESNSHVASEILQDDWVSDLQFCMSSRHNDVCESNI